MRLRSVAPPRGRILTDMTKTIDVVQRSVSRHYRRLINGGRWPHAWASEVYQRELAQSGLIVYHRPGGVRLAVLVCTDCHLILSHQMYGSWTTLYYEYEDPETFERLDQTITAVLHRTEAQHALHGGHVSGSQRDRTSA